jgi:hypothetical protein
VNTVVPIIDSDLGGRDVCLGNSRRARNGDEQGDQEGKTPYQHGEPAGRGRHRCLPMNSLDCWEVCRSGSGEIKDQPTMARRR